MYKLHEQFGLGKFMESGQRVLADGCLDPIVGFLSILKKNPVTAMPSKKCTRNTMIRLWYL